MRPSARTLRSAWQAAADRLIEADRARLRRRGFPKRVRCLGPECEAVVASTSPSHRLCDGCHRQAEADARGEVPAAGFVG
jgi:hypothetical protein